MRALRGVPPLPRTWKAREVACVWLRRSVAVGGVGWWVRSLEPTEGHSIRLGLRSVTALSGKRKLLGSGAVASMFLGIVAYAQDGVVRHPNLRDLDRPPSVEVRSLSVSNSAMADLGAVGVSTGSPALSARLESLRSMKRVGTIGGADELAAIDHVFGEISDVVIAGGFVYVLDARLVEVRVFTVSGEFVQRIGRAGPGPAEFSDPRSLAVDAERNLLYVSDGSREIEVFSTENPTTAEHVRSVRIPDADPLRICLLTDRIVLVNSRADKAVRAYSLEGVLQEAAGRLYGASNATVRSSLGETLILCNPAHESVVVATRDIGEVRAYEIPAERPEWIAFDSRFLDMAYVYEEPPMVYTPTPTRAARIESLALLDDDHVLAQIALYETYYETTGAPPALLSLRSFVIAMESGAVVFAGEDLPPIVGVDGDHVVVAEDTLDTQLGIYDVGR